MRKMWISILILCVSVPSFAKPLFEEDDPLSAWVRLDTNLFHGKKATGRCAEIFLTKGDLSPIDMYYFDSGDGLYQEVGITAGVKAFKAFGLDFWALPYFVAATDADYFGPCLWINGGWGKIKFNSLPMFYVPLEKKGTEQFTTCDTYLNYEITDNIQLGVGGNAYWSDEWSWRIGPNLKIKDPFSVLPGGSGDFTVRATWDRHGEWRLFLQKTFTF